MKSWQHTRQGDRDSTEKCSTYQIPSSEDKHLRREILLVVRATVRQSCSEVTRTSEKQPYISSTSGETPTALRYPRDSSVKRGRERVQLGRETAYQVRSNSNIAELGRMLKVCREIKVGEVDTSTTWISRRQ